MGNCIDGPKKKSSITKGPFTVAKGVKLIWDQEEERWVKAPINIQISPATFATGSMRIVHRAWELTMDAKGMASEQDVLDEVRVARARTRARAAAQGHGARGARARRTARRARRYHVARAPPVTPHTDLSTPRQGPSPRWSKITTDIAGHFDDAYDELVFVGGADVVHG